MHADILVANKQLACEIEFDLRKFEEEQKRQEQLRAVGRRSSSAVVWRSFHRYCVAGNRKNPNCCFGFCKCIWLLRRLGIYIVSFILYLVKLCGNASWLCHQRSSLGTTRPELVLAKG